MKYVRPTIVVDENMAEGVYATGDSGGNTACESVYMKGVHQNSQTTILGNEYKRKDRGCEGCPADQGGQCRPDLGSFGSPLKPTWERNGDNPEDTFIYWG